MRTTFAVGAALMMAAVVAGAGSRAKNRRGAAEPDTSERLS
jgi:hypothetical protein